MHKINLLLHKKKVKICLTVLLAVIALLCLFRVPTRVAVCSLNRNTNLPVSLLMRTRDADFTDFTVGHGFGMTSYLQSDSNGGNLRVDVSMWPDTIFGKQRINYAAWTNENISVYGFSVGDDLANAEKSLLRHGFVKTRDSDEFCWQYRKFGLIISCFPERDTGVIHSISIRIQGTNIFGIVY